MDMTTNLMGVDRGSVSRPRDAVDPETDPLLGRYQCVRQLTDRLCAPLEPEDYVVQSMPDVSPTKWHLAHTSWFFETFLLKPRGYVSPHSAYAVLFNSYYNGVGEQFPRYRRGMLSRPGVNEVMSYRAHVDDAVQRALADGLTERERDIVELGLQHEQQHQELLLTDIKHVFAQSPLLPNYGAPRSPSDEATTPPMRFIAIAGGEVEVGHVGGGFHFDNEGPRHRAILPSFALSDRLVTVEEYRAFIDDGGYQRPELWLDIGWHWVTTEGVVGPLYWEAEDGADGHRHAFTLGGHRRLEPAEPVVHVSLFEADAYAGWAGARLPREHELELALRARPLRGNFVESGALHPRPARGDEDIRQLWGDGWEWTQSSYDAYPGYRPPPGAVGEYNGKFMCNQYVLRGGSCVSSREHLRATYRNFFPADVRWQFTSIRLAKDA